MKYLACKIRRKSSPVLNQGFSFSSSLSVPTVSPNPCQLETHSPQDACFFTLCPLLLLFSFFTPLAFCFWPSQAGFRRWTIRHNTGVFASQHLGLLCVRSPSVMNRVCGPFAYLTCGSLMWAMTPLVELL